jgi:hypothetical protein
LARLATRRTVSQITFGERSDLRTLAGRLFGITYSSGPTATSLDSHAARRIATSSSGIGFTTTLGRTPTASSDWPCSRSFSRSLSSSTPSGSRPRSATMRGSAAAGWLDHRGADAGERMSEKIDYEG